MKNVVSGVCGALVGAVAASGICCAVPPLLVLKVSGGVLGIVIAVIVIASIIMFLKWEPPQY